MGKILKNAVAASILCIPAWIILASLSQQTGATLWVHLSEPNVKVFVGDREFRAESTTVGPLEIAPGEHTLRVARGRETIYSHPIVLESGATRNVWAVWKPRAATAPHGGSLSVEGEHRFEGHRGVVRALVFSGNGHYLVSAGEDATVRVWDTTTRREVRTLEGHFSKVIGVAALGDGEKVVTVGDDATIRIWDVGSGHELRKIETGASWATRCAAISGDGRFAAFGADGCLVFVWDLEANVQVQRHEIGPCSAGGLAFSSDGRSLLVGLIGDPFTPHDVEVFDVPSGRVLTRFKGHEEAVWSVAFLPDGRRAVSTASDRTMRLWDVATGRELRRFDDHPGVVLCVAVSPDGRRALTGTGHAWSEGWRPAGTYGLQLWDLETGLGIGRFETTEPIRSLAFSPDGRRALAAGDDQIIHSWILPL